MSHRIAILFLALAMSCTSAEEPTASPDPDSGTDAAKPDTAIADTGVVVDSSGPSDTGTAVTDSGEPDTIADVPVDAPPLDPMDCWTGAYGTSSGTLVNFLYELQTGGCESSACMDFVTLDAACEMTLQVADVKYTATVEAGDCFNFKRWLTSQVLIDRINDLTTCYYGKGGSGRFEASTITLDGGVSAKKTWLCGTEPFVSHRTCVTSFRAKYFPGK
jgi:hypothetical protein